MLLQETLYQLFFILDLPRFVAGFACAIDWKRPMSSRVHSTLSLIRARVQHCCAIFLPLGTLYFAMQHGVDKYLLFDVRCCIKKNAIALMLGQIYESAD